MTKPIKIACIGEVMIELIALDNGTATLGVAGDTFNTAVYIGRAGKPSDMTVTYVTALGTDLFSERIVSEINRHGMHSDHIEYRDTQLPGLYAIDTDEYGERSFTYWRGESAARSLFQEPCKIRPDALLAFDLIYISGISMAILPPATRAMLIDFLKTYRHAGGKLAFDSNYRPRLWENTETAREITMSMWSITDIALPSLDDEMLLFADTDENQVLQRLANAGISCGALKRGINGPKAIGEDTGKISFPKVTNIIDTTAAGDSFNAGFLSSYMINGELSDAMKNGHQLASKVIQSRGAIIEFD